MKIALAGVAMITIASSAQADSSPRKAIERQYRRWAAAYVKNDVDTILAVLAPDYTLKTFSGQVIPLANYRSSLAAKKASGVKNNSYTTKIKRLVMNGKQAAVTSDETSVTAVIDPISHKKRRLIHLHEYLDTWGNLNGSWRLHSTVTTVEKTTVSGS